MKKVIECYSIEYFPVVVGKPTYIFPTEMYIQLYDNVEKLQRKYGLTKTKNVINILSNELFETDDALYKIVKR